MLAKPRVNKLDGEHCEIAEKVLRGSTRAWSMHKTKGFRRLKGSGLDACRRGVTGQQQTFTTELRVGRDYYSACRTFAQAGKLRFSSGSGTRDVVLKKFLGLAPGTN